MSFVFDSIEKQPYASELYAPEALIEPINGLDQFDDSLVEQFNSIGFVSVANVLNSQQIQGVLNAMFEIATGPLAQKVEMQFESEAKGIVENAPRDQVLDYLRKFMYFSEYNEVTKHLMYEPRMMQIVEKLLGGEATMFQDMALLKPPGIGREKPWHQDHAYFNLPEGTPVVGVWIALDDTTPDNGCMHFIPGSHKEGPIPHWNRRDWQICDSEILSRKGQVAAPLKAGGLVIFDGLILHGTPNNTTNTRRRAIQWHYVRKDTPRISTEERLELFGSEGRNVTC